jgi:hypothetical protein
MLVLRILNDDTIQCEDCLALDPPSETENNVLIVKVYYGTCKTCGRSNEYESHAA